LKKFVKLKFKGNLDVERVLSNYAVRMILDEIKIFGVDSNPINVSINGQNFDNFDYDDLNMVNF
jgi:hypothetical protein